MISNPNHCAAERQTSRTRPTNPALVARLKEAKLSAIMEEDRHVGGGKGRFPPSRRWGSGPAADAG